MSLSSDATITVPPRISNTPPPIDSSFEESSSNNSKSAEENFHLDDSDCIDNTKLDEILATNEIETSTDIAARDRLETLSFVEAESSIQSENTTRERVETIKQDEGDQVETVIDECINTDGFSLKSIENDANSQDEDLFNLSDDKLKTIIENFKISSSVDVVPETSSNNEEFFEKQEHQPIEEDSKFASDWDPFAENVSENNNADDWAAFEGPSDNQSSFLAFQTPSVDLFVQSEDQVVKEEEKMEEEEEWDNFVSIENVTSEAAAVDNFENFLINARKLFEKSIEAEKEFETDGGAHVEEKYLFETEYVNEAWNKLLDYKNSDSLKFVWRGSKFEEFYLNSINIDKKNVNTTSRLLDKNRYTTIFSSNNMDNILQPTKVESTKQNSSVPVGSHFVDHSKSTNIINSTDVSTSFGHLDFDLSYLESKITSNETKKQTTTTNQLLNELLCDINSVKSIESKNVTTKSASSPSSSSMASNFELILTPQFNGTAAAASANQQQPTSVTTTVIKTNIDANSSKKINQKAVDLLDRLPNLSFMKSKVLMFPLSSSNKTNFN